MKWYLFWKMRFEDASAAIFKKPIDGCASNDSANKNDGGPIIDNFPRSQFNAPAEALLSGG